MKNKGFTIIELLVTFSLVALISVLLFQIIMSLREIYVIGDIETTLLSKQGILVKKINDDFNSQSLKQVTSCGNTCIAFTFEDGSTRNLTIDPEKHLIKYHDYTWKLGEGDQIGTVETKQYRTETMGMFQIIIPVSNKLSDQDFGIDFLYQYENLKTTVPSQILKPSDMDQEIYNQYAFFR